MTNYVPNCLRSIQKGLALTATLLLASNIAFAGCTDHLKGKSYIGAHDASDAIDVIVSLYNSNKTLAYDFTTSMKGQPNLTELLRPQVDIILNFSRFASKEARLRFQRQQSAEHTKFVSSRFYDGRNDYEELSKLTGTLMLVGDSGSSAAKAADEVALNLTLFFAEIGLPFSVPKALSEAKQRDQELSDEIFTVRIHRLKYNYALLLLAEDGNAQAIETLKTYADQLSMDKYSVDNQLKEYGSVIVDQNDEMILAESGQHPGRFRSSSRRRQKNTVESSTLLQRLLNRINF